MRCRPPTTTWWPWATRTSSNALSRHPTSHQRNGEHHEQESTPGHHRPGPAGRRLRQVHHRRAGPEHGDRRHLRHRPREEGTGRRPRTRTRLLRGLHRHAGKRRRRCGRHLRAALPAPGNGHRDAQAQHPRARGEAGRRVHQAGQGAQRVCRGQAGAVLRHHVQPAQQPAVPEAQGDRRQRRDRQHPPHQLDHHQLVAPAGLLQLQRMARHVGRRGRRRAGQPGTAPAGPVAVDLRRARSPSTPRWPTASAATSPSRTR